MLVLATNTRRSLSLSRCARAGSSESTGRLGQNNNHVVEVLPHQVNTNAWGTDTETSSREGPSEAVQTAFTNLENSTKVTFDQQLHQSLYRDHRSKPNDSQRYRLAP